MECILLAYYTLSSYISDDLNSKEFDSEHNPLKTFQNSARWNLTTSITARFAAISPSSGRAKASSASDGCSADSAEISDEVLMARIGDGDKEGLACLFHRYARLVRAVGYKILRDD